MRYRRFGQTELSVSEVGFGCARIGGLFEGNSRSDMLRLIRRALDEGITFFDTADMYTQGESERLLGEALGRDRERVVIASKFGFTLPAQKWLMSRVKPLVKPLVVRLGLRSQQVHAGLRGAVSQQDFSPAYIERAVEASLRRLKTDYLDVYQLHAPPLEVLERGEFVEPLERLRQQGKVRHWGVACESHEDVPACLQYPGLAALQIGLSALEQAALDAAIPNAAERGVAIIARQVFASGLLTKPVEAVHIQLDPDPVVDANKRTQLAAYGAIVAQCGRSRAELALQFALARDDVAVVLLGLSRAEHLDEGLQALQAPELRDEELKLLVAARRTGR